MAEIVATALISVLCEKLISVDLMKLARSEGIDSQMKKWKKTLPMIQAVLADAGQKQIKERAVQLWLDNLQDLAYDIDDVLDDLATEAIQRKLDRESDADTNSISSTSKVFKFIPTCCTNFSPRYGRRLSSTIDEITTKLNDLVEVKNGLGFVVNVNVDIANRTERRLEQTSLVDESKIMGREGDKEALLGKLLGNDEKMRIVSIVGMGGIGKTTLAKVLYNEEKVKDHFELRAWVCVSEELDVLNISKVIFQAVTGKNRDFANLDLLHVALKEKLLKKRFLLVLDDVWNEEKSKWELLQSPLVGAPGSKIIVTTRNTRVASVVDSDESYYLELLSNEDAISLFAQHSLGENNFENHPTLQLHGEGIVKKCGRLPLALKTLGNVLKGNRNGDEWEKLLNSEIWDIQDGSEILPALRLSYNHLPPHLKLLFAYCSLFPKDYVFDKKELVLLWMAEGFLLQPNRNKSMEILGHQYFEELKSRSFFQPSMNDDVRYTMHDLINDLATSVAGEFVFRLDDEMDSSNKKGTFENFRHFSLVGPQGGSYRKLKELQRARRLRSFLTMSRVDNSFFELLPLLQFLRVLSLANYVISEVPQSIGSLKHLRYINFSYTTITYIPEEVSDLYNLQSLLVHGCSELYDLPKSFAKLINLRHLDISGTPKLKKMPLGIGVLTNLQTLPKVIIEPGNGFKISELKNLSDLQGRISIMGLDKVINPIQAQDANFHQKKGLDILEMIWSDVFDDSRNDMNEYEVLKRLRPHHKLRNLEILFYKGTQFPSWVGDPSFDQLTELTLRCCRSLHLPTLGHLRSLRRLFVERMNEVKTIDFELLSPTNSLVGIAFPSLEVLEFDDMQGWQIWSSIGASDDGTARSFPCLREISIKRCPLLAKVSIGFIPSLRFLHIDECCEGVLRSMIGVSSSLVELEMLNVKGFTQLHGEDLTRLGAVEYLFFDECDELRYLWEPESDAYKNLVSLKKLVVHSCYTLESLNCPNSVERLVINRCHSMTSLIFSVNELPSSIIETIICDSDNTEPVQERGFGVLPPLCLRYLDVHNCKNLNSFPHDRLQSLTCLEELRIHGCPNMDYSFPSGVWAPNLSILRIGDLKKPMSEWGPQNFPTSLVELQLYGHNSGVGSFAVEKDAKNTTTSSFLLPPTLASLIVFDFIDVDSLSEVVQQLPCLKSLEIFSCPKLSDVHEIASYRSSLTVSVIP
ncbi:putative disease resistance RPP13-like protein 1 [Lactuca sativa]|uniref:Uncharacterized protein n=1 Tax=Lactuca sativa TaxID=4236 RepID=A0A9R1WK07_LACSA|nr:putative disease resistance RPP13-like protein 1 [Lactuca sativa]KAJ0224172.1 hypothetical protein LSAT_V11C100036080 [Lactuca sativa]